MKALLLLAFPFAEIYLTFFVMGKAVGGWMLLLWFVMAFMVGRQLMRGATKVIMPQMQQVQQGQSPDMDGQLLAAFCQALAGFLFIVPGVLTDGFAVLLLLPPIQKLFQRQMHMAFAARSSRFMMMGGFGQGQSPFGRSPFDSSNVFDGEAKDITPQDVTDIELKRLEKKSE
ncbi:MAG: hypothetical protein RJA86_1485 [Pseudomonadota bacterium]